MRLFAVSDSVLQIVPIWKAVPTYGQLLYILFVDCFQDLMRLLT